MAKRRAGGRAGFFSNRRWIAIESVLVVGLLKDWLAARVLASGLPGYGRVLFVMAVTIGLFGGLYFFVEELTAQGVARTQLAARRMPIAVPTLVMHAIVLGALFLLYARTFHIDVL